MTAASPFISDVPAAEALRRGRRPAPPPVPGAGAGRAWSRSADAVGRVTAAVGVGAAFLAGVRLGRHGRHRRPGRHPRRRRRETPVLLAARRFEVVDTGDPLPDGYDAVVMREHVHWTASGQRGAAGRRAALPTRPLDRRGHQRHRAAPARRAPAAPGRRGRVRRRRGPRADGPAPPVVVIVPTGDEIRPIGTEPEPGEILDTNSLMLAAQAREIGCDGRVTDIIADDPDLIVAALVEAAVDADLVILVAGSSAGRDDYTAQRRRRSRNAGRARRGRTTRPSRRARDGGRRDRHPGPRRPRLPGLGRAHVRHLRRPAPGPLWRGPHRRERPATTARLARKLASAIGTDDWVRVRLGRVEGEIVATPLPRGAGVLTSLVRADGLLVVPAGVEGHHAGEQVQVQLLRGLGDIGRTIVAIGSHDLILDVAASALRAADPLISLASSNVGSLGGLVARARRAVPPSRLAPPRPRSGEYTLPYVDRLLGDGPRSP